MVWRAYQHEMRAGAADFGTCHHQLEMRRFGMLSTQLNGSRRTRLSVIQAGGFSRAFARAVKARHY
jgi:hypothetical protein